MCFIRNYIVILTLETVVNNLLRFHDTSPTSKRPRYNQLIENFSEYLLYEFNIKKPYATSLCLQ